MDLYTNTDRQPATPSPTNISSLSAEDEKWLDDAVRKFLNVYEVEIHDEIV